VTGGAIRAGMPNRPAWTGYSRHPEGDGVPPRPSTTAEVPFGMGSDRPELVVRARCSVLRPAARGVVGCLRATAGEPARGSVAELEDSEIAQRVGEHVFGVDIEAA
jgi:hypothetical protein